METPVADGGCPLIRRRPDRCTKRQRPPRPIFHRDRGPGSLTPSGARQRRAHGFKRGTRASQRERSSSPRQPDCSGRSRHSGISDAAHAHIPLPLVLKTIIIRGDLAVECSDASGRCLSRRGTIPGRLSRSCRSSAGDSPDPGRRRSSSHHRRTPVFRGGTPPDSGHPSRGLGSSERDSTGCRGIRYRARRTPSG